MLQWEWFTDVNTAHLFQYLLLSANHKPTKWRGHIILPGELLTGRKKLAKDTGLSEQSVRTSLDKLKSTSDLTSRTFNKYSIITITNWDKYQDINQQVTSDLTNNQPASNQQVTTSKNIKTKECKKERNIENKPPDISDQTWEDFKILRASKKAPITKTSIGKIITQAMLANYTLEEALQECCARGWISFKAEWVNKQGDTNGNKTGFAGAYRVDSAENQKPSSNRNVLLSAILKA